MGRQKRHRPAQILCTPPSLTNPYTISDARLSAHKPARQQHSHTRGARSATLTNARQVSTSALGGEIELSSVLRTRTIVDRIRIRVLVKKLTFLKNL